MYLQTNRLSFYLFFLLILSFSSFTSENMDLKEHLVGISVSKDTVSVHLTSDFEIEEFRCIDEFQAHSFIDAGGLRVNNKLLGFVRVPIFSIYVSAKSGFCSMRIFDGGEQIYKIENFFKRGMAPVIYASLTISQDINPGLYQIIGCNQVESLNCGASFKKEVSKRVIQY